MNGLSNRRIAAILAEYSVTVDADSPLIEGIRSYISLLLQWNRSISLTTITDPEEIARFHFGESLLASSFVPITRGRLADVGTGAGFPGLPLKMLIPPLHLTLVESNAKKVAFLAEIVRTLGLDGVHILRGRMEEYNTVSSSAPHRRFDFVTARAFGQFGKLLAWSKAHLAASGRLTLWLGEGDADSILKTGGWTWSRPVQIPGSKRRFIVSGMSRD
jgi:16S rRNA (guanine527-N7)-methyltransferase